MSTPYGAVPFDLSIHQPTTTPSKGPVVSFALAPQVTKALPQSAPKPVALTEVDSFLAIDAGGTVTVYSGKVDLGTGITTALRQIVAEELDVALPKVDLVQGDTALTPDQGKTWVFINGDVPLKQTKMVLPNLPEQLKLPEKQKPMIEKD